MSELCALLPWDSQHFGLICARALVTRLDEGVLRDISEWCRQEKVELLFFLADDDVTTWKLAAETGFQLVDVRMRLTLDRSGAQGTGSLEVAPKLGVRETRRILGQYVLTEADVRGNARFRSAMVLSGARSSMSQTASAATRPSS